MKYLLILFFSVFFISLIVFQQKHTKSRAIKHFDMFDNSNIDGILNEVKISHKGVGFKLEDNIQKYVFYPHVNKELNKSIIFNLFAKNGDRVIKKPYSDTLILIKNNKHLNFTFDEF